MTQKRPITVAAVIVLSAASTACAREISFSGYTWTVKNSGSAVGPGPNVFSDSTDNVWVDSAGRLHLKIVKRGNTWTCAEVIAKASFGYGTYWVVYDTPVDALDPSVVLALFTWSNRQAYHHREIDIELSRWGDPNSLNAQYVVQPYWVSSRIHRWEVPGGAPTSHGFRWAPDSVLLQSYGGRGADLPLQSWQYAGRKVPVPGGETPRMNLWLFHGSPPTDGQPVEVIISKFEWVP